MTKDGNYKELLETIMKLTRQNVLQVGRIMNLVAMIRTMAEYEQDSKVLHTMNAEVKMCLATLKKRRESEEEGGQGEYPEPPTPTMSVAIAKRLDMGDKEAVEAAV